MQISHEDNLDGVSNGLLIKPNEHKWPWLTLQAIFPLVIFLVLVAKAAATPAYPLRPSANGRYIVDNNGHPFLIIGDAPHSILNKLNNTDAATYIQSRASHGFNAHWIELLCDAYTFGYGTEGSANYGRDVNGNNPFTSKLQGGYYDLTTPNAAYWSHVDDIVQIAAENGVLCYLTPLDQGGWTQTALANGTTRCRQYGTFLGNRYKNSPNVIWNLGNDFQYWNPPGIDDATLAIADGIRSEDSKVLTVQFIFPASNSQDDPPWVSRVNVNSVYTYLPGYDETYAAWNAGRIMPVLWAEGPYEDESGYGGYTGTPNTLRRGEYWSLTAGALAGHMWGSYWTDRFDPAWQSHLNSQGTIELGYFKSFVTALHWYDLVPDQTHSLITAGYGTYTSTGTPESSNCATGAKTADGTLAVIYTPVSHTLTVALGGFAGPVTAQWYDPTHNTFSTVSGSPFNNSGTHNFATPGNNHAGDPDWVLLLRTQAGTPTPPPTPTPTPMPSATPTPTSILANISTRSFVQTADNVMIGGFIVQGSQPKRVIIRAIGPELTQFGVPNVSENPTLELHDGAGALIAFNDNWQTTIIGGIITHDQVQEILNSGRPPTDARESAIIADLPAGNYTAIARGLSSTTGVALVEVYDLSPNADSILANISTRSFVQTADNVMIGGFIVQGMQPKMVIIRAIGPELTQFGVPNVLANPTLELHNGAGVLIASNDNWQTTIIGGIITSDQRRDIRNSGHAPGDGRESAIIANLPAGNYTAIVRGVIDTTGVALVEVYDLQ